MKIVYKKLALCRKMSRLTNYIKKAFIFIICLQIMSLNFPFTSFANAVHSHYISTQKPSEETSKKQSGEAKEAPNNEDESKEENENFALKIFTSPTKILMIYNAQDAKFILYNAQHTIQFHPEFSTPPPKQLFA